MTKATPKKATVQFGAPIDDLPEARNGGSNGPAEHWLKVAAHAKANPGQWHPVSIAHLTVKGHQSAASTINAASRNSDSKTGKNKAFNESGFQAAYREGRLYVRYDVPEYLRAVGGKCGVA